MFFHVRVWPQSPRQQLSGEIWAFNLSEVELRERFLVPHDEGLPIAWEGRTLGGGDVAVLTVSASDYEVDLTTGASQREKHAAFKALDDVTRHWVTRPAGSASAPGRSASASSLTSAGQVGDTVADRISVSTMKVFIGSSSEGLPVARNLQAELEAAGKCEVTRWDVNVFEPSGYTLDSLTRTASSMDFAVLIASADDITTSRGVESESVRDNVILEFGLFVGALGRQRTYLLATGGRDVKLPTDVLGLTRLPYTHRSDGDLRASVNSAVLQIERQMSELGPRVKIGTVSRDDSRDRGLLHEELQLLAANATSQGWTVKTDSETTFRVQSPRGRTFTLPKRRPSVSREDLRVFVDELRGGGLRVNHTLRMPPEDSPLG